MGKLRVINPAPRRRAKAKRRKSNPVHTAWIVGIGLAAIGTVIAVVEAKKIKERIEKAKSTGLGGSSIWDPLTGSSGGSIPPVRPPIEPPAPIPPKDPPSLDPTVGGSIVKHESAPGVINFGSKIVTNDLKKWIVYASPKVKEMVEGSDASASEVMIEVLPGDLPPSIKLNGKTLSDVRTKVQAFIDRVRNKTYLAAASPDSRIAAILVGQDLIPDDSEFLAYKGHVILARPAIVSGQQGGLAPDLSSRMEYLIWNGAMRGYDDHALHRYLMPSGATIASTIAKAKTKLSVVPPPSVGDIAGTGGDSSVAIPDWNPDPIIYAPKTKVYSITGTFAERSKQDIVVFDFKTGQNRLRKDWTIRIGLCLKAPPGNTPFGALSNGINTGNWGIPEDQFEDVTMRIMIRNADQAPMNFDTFVTPLAFKGEFKGEFERHVTTKITKQLSENLLTPDFDVCPDLENRWPTPRTTAGFLVASETQPDLWRKWDSVPRFKLIHNGSQILLRITYSGFPIFVRGEDDRFYARNTEAQFKLHVKVEAIGTGT